MGKRKLRRRIESLERMIREHWRKIVEEKQKTNVDKGLIRHWETEIQAFEEGIQRAKKRLGERP